MQVLTNRFLKDLDYKGYAYNTKKSYTKDLKRFLIFCDLKNYKYPEDVKPIDIVKFAKLLQSGYFSEGQALSNKSINLALTSVKSFFTFLVNTGQAKYCPVNSYHYLKVQAPPIKIVDEEQYQKLISLCDNNLIKFSLILMFRAGLRRSELNYLPVENLSLSSRPHIILDKTKNRKPRVCPIFATKEELNFLSDFQDKSFFLFTGEMHSKISYAFEKFKTQGEEVSPHELRRGFATQRASEGIAIQLIARMLGHESILTTMRYILITNSDLLNLVG